MSCRHTGVVPYLMSPDCQKHIEWLTKVFDAKQEAIYFTDDTKTVVMHASISINDGVLYICDYNCMPEQKDAKDSSHPGAVKGSMFQIEVANQAAADQLWKKILDNEGKVTMELKAQFWEGYYGTAVDPFGYEWAICSSLDKKDEQPKALI
uniref:Filaggrin isoform X13-like protein n=1 Tax=Halisarca dujardinii TaxID=2583056 RepID=A0AA96MN34_HALDU|nr:filaggrin isoform X13-like protein [Halisarca dujardinii]